MSSAPDLSAARRRSTVPSLDALSTATRNVGRVDVERKLESVRSVYARRLCVTRTATSFMGKSPATGIVPYAHPVEKGSLGGAKFGHADSKATFGDRLEGVLLR